MAHGERAERMGHRPAELTKRCRRSWMPKTRYFKRLARRMARRDGQKAVAEGLG